jgi:CHAT domain-containing protein
MVGLPVEMLPDERGRPYGDGIAISYAPSAAFCAWSAERPKSRARRGSALVVGDPILTARAALPTSEAEVACVAATFPDARVLSGAHATEGELVRLAADGELATFSTLHFATHAEVDALRPERSALVLTPESRVGPTAGRGRDRLTDGRLSAWEVAREWRIDADLVTLSGCGTALGRPVEGEGYLGFAHVLLRAGAHALVLSLWNVDDEATACIMGRFYQNLARGTGSKAASLQEARAWLREFRREDGSAPFVHPAYWAAFVLIGAATD